MSATLTNRVAFQTAADLGPHGGQSVLAAGADLADADAVVVLLHGRGATAAGILALADELDATGRVAFLAPQASAAAGRAWYPLSFLAPRRENEPYLSSALAAVADVLGMAEAAGVPPARVGLLGFSQGACLAAEVAAREPGRVGGLVALTGGLIGPSIALANYAAEGRPLAGRPVLLTGGDPDPHVPWRRVEETAAVLRDLGADVTVRRYPGRPHTITSDELALATGVVRHLSKPERRLPGGGEVARYVGRHGTGRVAGVVLVSAIPPLMLKTPQNPGGVPMDAFDGIRAGSLADRSQFYLDFAAGPFFGFNRPGAAVSQGLIDSFWHQSMMGGHKNLYDCITAFSETDFHEDLKKFDVPTLVLHGDDDQVVPIDVGGRRSAELVKGAELKVYEGAPHAISSTHKDRVSEDLLAFIRD